jgi:glutamate synthase (ferredoxin)
MGAEDAQMVVESMAQTGVEPTYCMGDDIPLAVLSDKPHMLADYFKQRFAQVGGAACLLASLASVCCAGAMSV